MKWNSFIKKHVTVNRAEHARARPRSDPETQVDSWRIWRPYIHFDTCRSVPAAVSPEGSRPVHPYKRR